jgi:hypothetical protein
MTTAHNFAPLNLTALPIQVATYITEINATF